DHQGKQHQQHQIREQFDRGGLQALERVSQTNAPAYLEHAPLVEYLLDLLDRDAFKEALLGTDIETETAREMAGAIKDGEVPRRGDLRDSQFVLAVGGLEVALCGGQARTVEGIGRRGRGRRQLYLHWLAAAVVQFA